MTSPTSVFSNDDVTGVLKIAGTLDLYVADSLRDALLDCLQHCPEVALDLADVESCDAAALQVLLASRESAVALGKTFRAINVSQPLKETAGALGLSLDGPAGRESQCISI